MNEESKFTRATDDSLLEKLTKHLSKNAHFRRPKTKSPQFLVVHYAAEVQMMHVFLNELRLLTLCPFIFLEGLYFILFVTRSPARPSCTLPFCWQVLYDITGFLEKNRDTLPFPVVTALACSENYVVSQMFNSIVTSNG